MSDPVFIDFFEDFCEVKNIREYYLIDKNGSFLCVNNENKKICLALHSEKSINTWLSIYGEELTKTPEKLNLIQSRKAMFFFGVDKEAWQINSAEWGEYFYTTHTLSGRIKYFLSEISINEE